MQTSRPYSQASSNRSSNKPTLQRKLKPRMKALSNVEDKLIIKDQSKNGNKMKFNHSMFLSNCNKTENEIKLNEIANNLSQTNFKNHFSDSCVCQDCTCGRHLCKLNNIKADLTKNTIYKKDFTKKGMVSSEVIYSKNYEKLKGPYLDMNSTQRSSFIERERIKVFKPIPKDLLKSEGPSQNMTTYKCVFAGHRGLNQYVLI